MTQRATTAAAWAEVWYGLGGRPGSMRLYGELRVAYAEAHRAYHTLEHVEHCLRALEEFRGLAQRPSEVAIALWFHDAVYDPRATDNEARSAEWAAAALRAHEIDADAAARVRAMILATQHTAVTHAGDAALVVDLDLGILGQSPEVFDRYDRQIRREYEWVSEQRYRAARTRVLQAFLGRDVIYRCPPIRERLEAPARANLRHAIDRLARSD